MRERLPVEIENWELPKDEFVVRKQSVSYGYVNVLYILSMLITTASVLIVVFLGNR